MLHRRYDLRDNDFRGHDAADVMGWRGSCRTHNYGKIKHTISIGILAVAWQQAAEIRATATKAMRHLLLMF